ncbi:tigger transposable element-derived protein 1-like [Teleopsis dalmanni]|uniref:tigger transposable element-derived protein 1-like n=1 Tax=Teleopsis dalmanni TaxID=139649 RepID=UPI0018CF5B5C|nr:tigger transposable element-derived protein 1-like [Teleopsis dalmanni]XP_037941354.1 tigger transposable element-derived protein 1-like [Teleopsis dalmanni]
MNKRENKTKRTVISLETKIKILKRLAEGEGSTALGKEFGLGESTIRGIQKRAGEISASSHCATNESVKRSSYSRNILIEKMEKVLISWIQQLTQKRIPVDGELIKEQAIWFYNQLKDLQPSCSSSHIGSSKFSASNGWLAGFSQRHALHKLKISGEAAPANVTATNKYSKQLEKIIEDGSYSPEQIFIAKLKQEEPETITAGNIYAGLQICNKLENHFLAIDGNSKRALKFQKELQSCISGYRNIYKRLVKQRLSQKLITDYITIQKKPNLNECKGLSISDESDFEEACDKKFRVSLDDEE